MPKSRNRAGHSKKAQQFKKQIKMSKERDKREFQKYIQMKQEEYFMKQQQENESQVEVDQNLIEEAGEFKLD